jgi:hypothetical protein
VAWTEAPDSALRRSRHGSFFDQLANHADKCRMRAGRSGANQLHSQLARYILRFDIEIVKYFHVIRNEADGRHQHVFHALRMQISQMIENIRLKPRLSRRAAAALIHQFPVFRAGRLPDETHRFP